jgi:hypothetical protein
VLLTAIANRGHVHMGDELVQEVLNMARAADCWNEHCKALEDTPSDALRSWVAAL